MNGDFVVDNSIVMAWCFEDESYEKTDTILKKLETATAYTPSLWPLEVCNVLLVAERRKRINEAETARFIALLSRLPIIVVQETPEQTLRGIVMLARNHGLSSYDAAYLDLAMKKGLPLATQDKQLIRAATDCNVRLL